MLIVDQNANISQSRSDINVFVGCRLEIWDVENEPPAFLMSATSYFNHWKKFAKNIKSYFALSIRIHSQCLEQQLFLTHLIYLFNMWESCYHFFLLTTEEKLLLHPLLFAKYRRNYHTYSKKSVWEQSHNTCVWEHTHFWCFFLFLFIFHGSIPSKFTSNTQNSEQWTERPITHVVCKLTWSQHNSQ